MKQIHTNRTQRRALGLVFLASLSTLGCDVESTQQETSGIGDLDDAQPGDKDDTPSGSSMDGMGGGDPGKDTSSEPLACPTGVSIVLSDYLSTQIALSDLDGNTLSESLISTGSSVSDGLAFAISGDVALPSSKTTSGHVVLLDRYGTNVITWVAPSDAAVLSQLPVGTGFESNPQDYVEIDERTAVVSRWGQNGAAGAQAHDAGGDLLFIDLEDHSISSSLVLPAPGGLPARPSSLSMIEGELFVSLDRIALDFSETGEAMLVVVDTESREVTHEHTFDGRKACGRATLSPDGTTFAVACTGALNGVGETEDIQQSALLVFDATARPLELIETYEATDLLGIALQGSVTYVSDTLVLLKTQTPWGGNGNNELFSLNLETGDTQSLLEANSDDMGAGKGIVYGGITCAPGCSDVCLMSDADQGVLQRIEVQGDGSLKLLEAVVIEDSVGLPPKAMSLR